MGRPVTCYFTYTWGLPPPCKQALKLRFHRSGQMFKWTDECFTCINCLHGTVQILLQNLHGPLRGCIVSPVDQFGRQRKDCSITSEKNVMLNPSLFVFVVLAVWSSSRKPQITYHCHINKTRNTVSYRHLFWHTLSTFLDLIRITVPPLSP